MRADIHRRDGVRRGVVVGRAWSELRGVAREESGGTHDLESTALVGRVFGAIEGPDEVERVVVDEVDGHPRRLVVLAVCATSPRFRARSATTIACIFAAYAPAISLFTLRSRALDMLDRVAIQGVGRCTVEGIDTAGLYTAGL